MVSQKGLTVSLRNGVNGPLMREYDHNWCSRTRAIEATDGAVLCPEITIHADFNWHSADGLYVAIRYGSSPYEMTLWVPDPHKGKGLHERSDWTFKVPGKAEWDFVKRKHVYFAYEFCPVRVSRPSF